MEVIDKLLEVLVLNKLTIVPIIYILISAASAYGSALFAWWWFKIGKATEVYAYMTLLLVGIFASSVSASYGRWLSAARNDLEFHASLDSLDRMIGPVIVLLVVVAITLRMTRRVWILVHGTEEQINTELNISMCPHCGEPCPRWQAVEAQRAKDKRCKDDRRSGSDRRVKESECMGGE
jgi:hypothetical protein